MKKIFVALAVLLSIWTPSVSFANPNEGVDRYVFLQKTIERKDVRIIVVTYKSYGELEAAVRSHIGADPKYSAIRAHRVQAFSVLQKPNYDVCTIHMIDPIISYEPEYIGHELMHCVYGEFHK